MYSSRLENKLILPDIADVMQDYVSIQIDIDDTRIKAAAIVAQDIDISRRIGQDNIKRCVEPSSDADTALRELVIPPLCYFTYARALKMFQGNFTDSGYVIESEATDRNAAKSVGREMSSIAEDYMTRVVEFLDKENPNSEEVKKDNGVPSVRVVGGVEDWELRGHNSFFRR